MKAEDKLREMLVHCGANIREFKDARYPTIARFMKSVGSLEANGWSGIRKTDELPILVLSRTTSRALVADRAEIVSRIPALAKTLWIAFVDQEENPFFFRYALKNGAFSDNQSDVPIWTETDSRYTYLILTPDVTDMSLVETRANELNLLNATMWFQREQPSSRHDAPRTRTDPYGRKVTGSGTYKLKP
ncbi:MAG: hypothetical protein WCT54_02890 [Patescibacteria group bacterium]